MSNDAILLKKQSELEEIKKKIELRKESIKQSKIWEKLYDITHVLGEYSDWGGGEYHYRSSGLTISYTPNQDSYSIKLGYEGEEVFSCKKSFRDWEIYQYIPGEWESQILELYDKCVVEKQKKEIANVQNEINQLKQKWRL